MIFGHEMKLGRKSSDLFLGEEAVQKLRLLHGKKAGRQFPFRVSEDTPTNFEGSGVLYAIVERGLTKVRPTIMHRRDFDRARSLAYQLHSFYIWSISQPLSEPQSWWSSLSNVSSPLDGSYFPRPVFRAGLLSQCHSRHAALSMLVELLFENGERSLAKSPLHDS
jgi:hypothetical protein